ncbi:hypothetical protein Taro_021903, partial [Colocasia esculenta]|nr:hypothetical protein [Colocasia esculenta]
MLGFIGVRCKCLAFELLSGLFYGGTPFHDFCCECASRTVRFRKERVGFPAMSSQEYMDKMQLRQNYRNLWHTDLMRTVVADFPYCCLAFWCSVGRSQYLFDLQLKPHKVFSMLSKVTEAVAWAM